MTDNRVTKRNRTKGHAIIVQTLCRKQNIKQNNSTLKYYVCIASDLRKILFRGSFMCQWNPLIELSRPGFSANLSRSIIGLTDIIAWW
jgi:hypothetical protein